MKKNLNLAKKKKMPRFILLSKNKKPFLPLSFLIQTQLDLSACLSTTAIFQEARSAGYLGGGTHSLRAVRRYRSAPNQI